MVTWGTIEREKKEKKQNTEKERQRHREENPLNMKKWRGERRRQWAVKT